MLCHNCVMAGYSGTPLPRKLGIKPEHRVITAGAPKDLALVGLPEGATATTRGTQADIVLLFATTTSQLKQRFASAMDKIPSDGAIWVAWPKKSSGVATKLDFDVVQAHGLSAGLVDNKVCAVDDTWSGLRFVVRTEDRPSWPRG